MFENSAGPLFHTAASPVETAVARRRRPCFGRKHRKLESFFEQESRGSGLFLPLALRPHFERGRSGQLDWHIPHELDLGVEICGHSRFCRFGPTTATLVGHF